MTKSTVAIEGLHVILTTADGVRFRVTLAETERGAKSSFTRYCRLNGFTKTSKTTAEK